MGLNQLKVHEAMVRFSQIDALRGFAALGVFFFHVAMSVGFDKRVLPPIDIFGRTLSNVPDVFSLGAAGVSLFFVLSGFCLSLKPIGNGFLLASYYRDRFSRIYPSYFVAVIFSLAVTDFRGIDWSPLEVAGVLLFMQGGVQEWVFSLNGALWSMSTEVQFYLLFPLFLDW